MSCSSALGQPRAGAGEPRGLGEECAAPVQRLVVSRVGIDASSTRHAARRALRTRHRQPPHLLFASAPLPAPPTETPVGARRCAGRHRQFPFLRNNYAVAVATWGLLTNPHRRHRHVSLSTSERKQKTARTKNSGHGTSTVDPDKCTLWGRTKHYKLGAPCSAVNSRRNMHSAVRIQPHRRSKVAKVDLQGHPPSPFRLFRT